MKEITSLYIGITLGIMILDPNYTFNLLQVLALFFLYFTWKRLIEMDLIPYIHFLYGLGMFIGPSVYWVMLGYYFPFLLLVMLIRYAMYLVEEEETNLMKMDIGLLLSGVVVGSGLSETMITPVYLFVGIALAAVIWKITKLYVVYLLKED